MKRKKGKREEITLSLSLSLTIFSLYFSSFSGVVFPSIKPLRFMHMY